MQPSLQLEKSLAENRIGIALLLSGKVQVAYGKRELYQQHHFAAPTASCLSAHVASDKSLAAFAKLASPASQEQMEALRQWAGGDERVKIFPLLYGSVGKSEINKTPIKNTVWYDLQGDTNIFTFVSPGSFCPFKAAS